MEVGGGPGARGAGGGDDAPLVVTLALDDAAQAGFDALRRRHFPPERNHLAAHVTAFHALPADRLDAVVADLRATAPRAPVPVAVTGLRFLGRGVAYDLRCPQAEAVRAALADRWDAWLTPQDRRPWRPHVTVQNKVAPEVARTLHASLVAAPHPADDATGVAWHVFHYRGGPWEPVLSVPFGRATGPG